MTFDRQDVRYAAATVAAVGLVVYLVAGNFGLVPSPLPGVTRTEATSITVPDLALVPLEAGAPPAPEDTPTRVLPGILSNPDRATAPGPTGPVDAAAPSTAITTPDGTILVAAPGERGAIEGTATDGGSGVAGVQVTFRSGSTANVVEASLSCSGATHGFCAWRAEAPGIAGTWQVEARAVDRAGNREATPASIAVTVVTTQNLVDQGDTEPSLVGSVVDGAGAVVGGLAGLLGLR